MHATGQMSIQQVLTTVTSTTIWHRASKWQLNLGILIRQTKKRVNYTDVERVASFLPWYWVNMDTVNMAFQDVFVLERFPTAIKIALESILLDLGFDVRFLQMCCQRSLLK